MLTQTEETKCSFLFTLDTKSTPDTSQWNKVGVASLAQIKHINLMVLLEVGDEASKHSLFLQLFDYFR